MAYTEETKNVSYNLPTEHDYSNDYLTFKALDNASFTFWPNSVVSDGLSYSINDGGTWVSIEPETSTPTVSAGNKILFKGIFEGTLDGIGGFASTGRYEAMGNPYSMLYGDNFKGKLDISDKSSGIALLFDGDANLVSAKNLSLPATTFGDDCYKNMFRGCTSLTAAPELPALRLMQNCYLGMFNGCISLTTAPELPATTLAYNCYDKMFYGCTSLTTAPELPATTLVSQCYQQMFMNCGALNSIKMLATNVSASGCLARWVYGVASTGTFVKHPNMTSLPSGINGIPTGWTVQDASI